VTGFRHYAGVRLTFYSAPRRGSPLIGSGLCIVHIEGLLAPLLWQQELTILDDLGVHKGEGR
jgi:hypothetical protein